MNCKTDDANSAGSIKLLIYFSKPAVVDTRVDWRDRDEINPIVPRPWIVDWILDVVMVPPPGPKAVEKEDKAVLIEDVRDRVET